MLGQIVYLLPSLRLEKKGGKERKRESEKTKPDLFILVGRFRSPLA